GSSSIGQITTDGTGTVTKFAAASISYPTSITAGPDGALWITNAGNSSIGRTTTDATVTNFTDPSISDPPGIAAGPDSAMWFTNSGSSSRGRITAQPPGVPSSVQAVPFYDGSALVGWAAPPDNGRPITGYVVRPYLDGAPQPVRVFNSTSTRELVRNLKNGRSYQFTVAARNAGGTGHASAKTAAIIVGSPGRPQNVHAV